MAQQEAGNPEAGDIDVTSAVVANVATPADASEPRQWALKHVAEEWGMESTDLLTVNRMDAGTHGGPIVKVVFSPEDVLASEDGLCERE